LLLPIRSSTATRAALCGPNLAASAVKPKSERDRQISGLTNKFHVGTEITCLAFNEGLASRKISWEEPLDFDLFISGIGGQGVQLVGKVLALAAISEGRHVMLMGDYGGHMRGGSSVGSLVIGPERLIALPVLPSAGAAIVLSNQYFDHIADRLRPGSLLVAEATIAGELPEIRRHRLVGIDGLAIATEAGNRMAAGMAMLGAFAAVTGLVSTESLVAAAEQQVPVYRRQHIVVNERAIRAGAVAGMAARDATAPAPFARAS
jgi:Pyruvate/2-oxoacid:ferredoxin oxidoreductase gamma subunit